MADRNKFEEMLERLINEDKDGAEELFHEIVVEKSRSIYESLLEDDLEDEEVDESSDEEVDESDDEEVDEATDEDDDEDEEMSEDFDLDEFEVEGDDDMDPAGDLMKDAGMDMGDEGDMDMGGMDDEGEEGDVEDRVEDLEDALDELKAEFEKLMAGDEGGDDEGDMDDMGDMDDEGDDEGDDEAEEESFNFESDDEEVDEASDEEVEETSKKSETEQMREYVEKINATMGDNGANTKSIVAGKNDMGGTASNLVRGDTANDGEAGAGSKVKGSALNDQTTKEDNAGNVNVPGGKAGKSNKPMPKGHGAEKKGAGETAANKKSIIGSR